MEVLQTDLPNKVLITSLVNGLISTSVIWVFWTPFLIFIAAPFMNAAIKDQACYGLAKLPDEIIYNLGFQAWEIYSDNIPDPARVGENMVLQNKTAYNSDNLQLYLLFVFIGIVVIASSLLLARYLIITNGLDMREIIVFNLTMAGIIMFIEMLFFAGVTTQYIPFKASDILMQFAGKVNDLLSPITATDPASNPDTNFSGGTSFVRKERLRPPIHGTTLLR